MRYPIEHHASKIYTISVYKLFLQELLKSSSYIVTVLTDGALYEVRHVESSTREAWSRVIFNIEIDQLQWSILQMRVWVVQSFWHTLLPCT